MQDDTRQGDLLVILRHAPHGSSWLKEGLDVALVAAAFDRRVTLLFMGEGITALLEGQQAGPLGQKGTAPTLAMLEMYDIDSLLVEARGMDALGLTGEQFMLPVEGVGDAEIAELLASHALVLNF
ncbi:sulfurtransferase complex subunit TusC [Halomonas sp. SSL-5]|uniref:sulfurtransferase complex subunit TusC n=1 Tax=Halomonas sp. SSL-5 TaxID=3065855 RepID=UPI002739E78F|nr:sulfurtransferase complex subunit TusC [Halomonas sp. SSL-5]MDY7117567.1 sulfurtransferase complex subunit TusC [Halomonas sp. SSL-5]